MTGDQGEGRRFGWTGFRERPADPSREILCSLYDEAVRAVDPAAAVRAHLERTRVVSGGRTVRRLRPPVAVLAVGKASRAMAGAAAEALGPDVADGLVISPDDGGGSGAIPESGTTWRLLASAHPLPDGRSFAAGRAASALVDRARSRGTLLVLLSGGASSLMALPRQDVSDEEKRDLHERLLISGLGIAAVNRIRTAASGVKGGRLAARLGSTNAVVLYLSDVPGADPRIVGSGPFVRAASGFEAKLAADLARWAPDGLAEPVRRALDRPAMPRRVPRIPHVCVGDLAKALAAVRGAAGSEGLDARILPRRLRGEARRAGERLGRSIAAERPSRPACVVAGGETTVRVRGDGVGGRSQELALGAARALAGTAGWTLLAAGTDGRDGPTPHAGAFVDGTTIARGRALGLDPDSILERNDAARWFEALGDAFTPGPTGTNVADLVIAIFTPGSSRGRQPAVD